MRLKKALEAGDGQARIEWKSFMLRPQPDPSVTFNDYRRDAWQRAGAMEPATTFNLWTKDEPYPNCSLPALVAGKAAQRQGAERFERLHLLLFRALFTDNRNISDESVLVEVAQQAGLDVAQFRRDLRDESVRQEVMAEHNEAIRLGIHAVPTVIINGEQAIVGAVEVEEYGEALRRFT